jgi:hypothetical protein
VFNLERAIASTAMPPATPATSRSLPLRISIDLTHGRRFSELIFARI